MINSSQKPKALKKGDTIAVVSPAAPSTPEQFEQGLAWLQAQGFKTRLMPNAQNKHSYTAGTDDERLTDLIAALEDPEIDAVLCARGGYGSGRLLPRLPFQRWRDEGLPCKLLMGFSDITTLHHAFYQELGWVTFHSAMLTSNLIDPVADFSREHWLLATSETPYQPLPYTLPNQDAYTPLISGTAKGILRGGNLSLIAALCGTPWQPDYRGAIVIIEDWKESYYTLDRQFTQLLQAGIFEGAQALLFADYSQTRCEPDWPLHEQLHRLCGGLNIPMGFGFTIGHGAQTLTIPLGVQASFDAGVGCVAIEEFPFRPR